MFIWFVWNKGGLNFDQMKRHPSHLLEIWRNYSRKRPAFVGSFRFPRKAENLHSPKPSALRATPPSTACGRNRWCARCWTVFPARKSSPCAISWKRRSRAPPKRTRHESERSLQAGEGDAGARRRNAEGGGEHRSRRSIGRRHGQAHAFRKIGPQASRRRSVAAQARRQD